MDIYKIQRRFHIKPCQQLSLKDVSGYGIALSY